jgi:bifunctional polynucleotide phosphatase/kinase
VFHFKCPIELAKHNNMYRACYGPADEPKRQVIPGLAFTTYVTSFEPPDKSEGFDEVRLVNFIFEGDDEQRKKWDMYMLEV